MTDRLIVHIGTHKTGSSAIQTALSDADEYLLEEAGLLYPQAGRIATGGHLNLCWEVSEDDRFDAARGTTGDLVAEARRSQPASVVVSAETLTSRPRNPIYANWVVALADELAVDDVLVVAYVRPQWEYLDSLYTQRIKMGYIGSDYDAFIEENKVHPRLDYVTTFDQWERNFGERLDIRPYARELLVDGDTVRDFLAALHLEHLDVAAPRQVNRRPGVHAVAGLRLLYERLEGGSLETAQRGAFFRQAGEELEARFPGDHRFRGLTFERAQELERWFRPKNERFVAAHPDLAGLFSLPNRRDFPGPCTWTFRDGSPTEQREVLDVVDEIVARGT